MDDAGSSRPPGRRGAKPCRHCGECHWNVYEEKPGSGVWYARVMYRGRPKVRAVGSHKRALEVAEKWKVDIREKRFDPQALTFEDEPLAAAVKTYLQERTDLGPDWHRIARGWTESAEAKGKGVREFSTLDAEAFLKRRKDAGRSASTRNKDVAFLHAFFEWYELRRRKDHRRRPSRTR